MQTRRALDLGIQDDSHGHFEVAACVDIDVAVSLVVFQDGHRGLGDDAADQAFAAAGDGEVDQIRESEKLADGRAVGGGNELNGGLGQAAGDQLIGEHAMESLVGAQGFLAAAEDDSVSALDAEGGRVDGDVGTALEDHEDDAERDADLADVESVGTPACGDDLADRVGECGDVEEALGHVVDPAVGQGQAIDGGGGESRRLWPRRSRGRWRPGSRRGGRRAMRRTAAARRCEASPG